MFVAIRTTINCYGRGAIGSLSSMLRMYTEYAFVATALPTHQLLLLPGINAKVIILTAWKWVTICILASHLNGVIFCMDV